MDEMPLSNGSRSELLNCFSCQVKDHCVSNILRAVLRGNVEQKRARKSDHGVYVVRNAYKSFLNVVVGQNHVYCVCGGRNSSNCTVLEVWWYRGASEASKDMRVKMKLCEVMVYDDAFSWEPTNELMDF